MAAYLFSFVGWWIVPWVGLALGPPLIVLWLLGSRIAPATLTPMVRMLILFGCGIGLAKLWISSGVPVVLRVAGRLSE